MTTGIRRATVGGLALALLILSACGSDSSSTAASSSTASSQAAAPASLTIGLIQATDFTHAMPARTAEAQGFFTKLNLTVKIVAFTAGSDLVKALSSGSVDIGAATGLDVAQAEGNSVAVKAFYGVAANSPMSLISNASSGVHATSDLKGKSVGISKFGSLTDYLLKSISAAAGLSAADVKEVPLGSPPANMAALQSKQVDAILLPVEFAYVLQGKGQAVTSVRVTDASTPSQFGILMASSSYLASNASVIQRVVEAYAQSIAYMKANKAATVQLAVSKLGLTADVAGQSYDALMPDFTGDGTVNTAGLVAYAQALPGLKLATTVPTLDQMYTSQFVPAKTGG